MGWLKDKLSALKSGNHRKLMIVAGLVIVVLVGLAWLGSRAASNKGKAAKAKEYQQVIEQVKDLRLRGSDKQAQAILIGFTKKYPNNGDKDQQFQISNELAAIYQTTGDYKEAKVWQQKALDSNPEPGFSDYFNLAEACSLDKDKACSAKYYKLAFDALEGPNAMAGKDAYQRYIKSQLEKAEK